MTSSEPKCLVCNCEKTMPLDAKKLSKAIGCDVGTIHTQLCRAQVEHFEKSVISEDQLIVACTQEAPLFQEIAEEHGRGDRVSFVNIREMAGWSDDARTASPKIAALLDGSSFQFKPARLKSIVSDGLCLVYGAGQAAWEAAKLLSDKLSVTLLLSNDEDIILPSSGDIPIYRGDIKSSEGSFGEFTLTVDNYAPLMPSSRDGLNFVMARDGAKTQCSLILDLSENSPLFSGHTHRDGYKRVAANDPASILRAIIEFSDMVGEFEKPIYVDYNGNVCAHSRSQKTGCNRCLDVCPAGAITSAGEIVEIDAGICGGCGSCHAVCPTGAISYQYPDRSDVINRAQQFLTSYTKAGGKNPTILVHDETTGTEMISVLARYGKGLPANVLPNSFHSPTTIGHVEMLSLFSNGTQHILFLLDPKKADELSGLEMEAALTEAILSKLEFGSEPRITIICETDPEKIEEKIWNLPKSAKFKNTGFVATGTKRDIAKLALSALHKQSKAKPDVIELPANAPYGKLDIDVDACTLCMACTSSCPTGAISDTPGEPKLRFTESACVQCGLCVNTCPEQALTLVPQYNFSTSSQQPATLYEEEPFECITCGIPFATKSTIDRISAQLAGKHSMFQDEERSELIKMCEKCRIGAQANSANDPFSGKPRPRPRTSEDYIQAEKGNLSIDDFLMDD